MTLELIEQAVASGARRKQACAVVGLSSRTVERWRGGQGSDARRGPTTPPVNKLSADEQQEILRVVNEPRFCDLSPNQIVPLLADEKRYLASESTMYRILRKARLLTRRGRAKAPTRRPPRAHVATGPNQVWSWDITYLKSPVRGLYFYLYLIVDVWSRKVVGFDVYDTESSALASELFERTCASMGLNPQGIVLHSDNGGPMKGSTMVATLERLGVCPSFSRPHVSDDNPYSEALFRTLKYRPDFPTKPFSDVMSARAWVAGFVRWYNDEHLHSGIRFVTPSGRHAGKDKQVLADRHRVYLAARMRQPARWARATRNWGFIDTAYLNPDKPRSIKTSPDVSSSQQHASEKRRAV